MLLGTHTSGQAQNYLQFAHTEIPDLRVPDLSELDEQKGEVGGFGNAKKPFEWKIVQKINHPSEVNKARYQPQNPDIIATLPVDGRVLIFDRTKHELEPKADGSIKFEAEMVGHQKEGFGLNWSPLNEGHLVTGNEDATVRTWDLKGGYQKGNSSITPLKTYTGHSATVNDVQYHPIHGFLIASASDDLTWRIIDTRTESTKSALYTTQAHQDAVNCVSFHPEFEHLMITGSADKTIAMWDLRNYSKKVHSFQHHKDQVMNVQFHPQDAAIFASSSNDRRICMWDLSKVGDEQTPDEMEDGPPELSVSHHCTLVYMQLY
jgi:histone-binding protein RBBP4